MWFSDYARIILLVVSFFYYETSPLVFLTLYIFSASLDGNSLSICRWATLFFLFKWLIVIGMIRWCSLALFHIFVCNDVLVIVSICFCSGFREKYFLFIQAFCGTSKCSEALTSIWKLFIGECLALHLYFFSIFQQLLMESLQESWIKCRLLAPGSVTQLCNTAWPNRLGAANSVPYCSNRCKHFCEKLALIKSGAKDVSF
jgi:hypothetical protein